MVGLWLVLRPSRIFDTLEFIFVVFLVGTQSILLRINLRLSECQKHLLQRTLSHGISFQTEFFGNLHLAEEWTPTDPRAWDVIMHKSRMNVFQLTPYQILEVLFMTLIVISMSFTLPGYDSSIKFRNSSSSDSQPCEDFNLFIDIILLRLLPSSWNYEFMTY